MGNWVILVAGCSYLANPRDNGYPEVLTNRLGPEINNIASSAAGNHYISKEVIDNAIQHADEIEYVFVLWSGIMRVDVPVGQNVRDQLSLDYSFSMPGTNRFWFHSGGLKNNFSPNRLLDKVIRLSYYEHFANNDYLTNESNYHIRTAELVLQALNIPYDFGSIYDYYQPSNTESSCGVSTKSEEDLDFNFSIKSHPYEYCAEHGLLDCDGFHPTKEGLEQWLNSVKLKIDK